jgi:hypothetical protein
MCFRARLSAKLAASIACCGNSPQEGAAMSDSVFQDIGEYIHISRDTLELMRAASGFLPRGKKREEIQARIKAAEEALKRSDIALASKLGYHICQCRWPGEIMLWKEHERLFRCQNPDCGRTIKDLDFNRPISYGPSGVV